jgi:curved DNA-binding protein CbpA
VKLSDEKLLSGLVAPKDAAKDLTAEEYFLLSRIQSEVATKDLLPLCPWPKKETIERLHSLIEKKAVEWVEKQDLDRDFLHAIRMKENNLENANHYEILEVHPRASAQEIKKSYLDLSRKFHPDRFFSKNLGAYKQKLELIFSKIQKTYAVLKNPIEREAYDQRLSLQPKPNKPAEEKTKTKRKSMDPEFERLGKAEYHYKSGLAQQKDRDFLGAANSFALAMQLNSEREIYKKAYEQMKPLVAREKAKQTLEKAKAKYENRGADKEILSMAEEALHSDPSLAEAQLLSAKLILELNLVDRVRDAKERLLRAKASLPKDLEPTFQLGKAYLALGESKAAQKEFEEVLKRNPKHIQAKKHLDKLLE